MKVHLAPATVEERKRPYAALSFSSKVRVECNVDGLTTSFIPFVFEDLTIVLEIGADEQLMEGLLRHEVLRRLLLEQDYTVEIREILKNFKFGAKLFKALVVKYRVEGMGEGRGKGNGERVDPSSGLQDELTGVAYGVVERDDYVLYLLSEDVRISPRPGLSASGWTSNAEEAVRQALLVATWFREGRYEELPSLALKTESNELKAMVERWSNLLRVVVFGDVLRKLSDTQLNFSLARLIGDLNEFRRTTYFDPLRDVEKVALGILIARCGGGLSLEPDDYGVFCGTD